jgi:RHS repeat-associated protein
LKSVTEEDVTTWRSGTNPHIRDLKWQFGYDANGNLSSDSLPIGVQRLYVADQFGRTTDVYDPLGTRSSRAYDALNRVTTITQYTAAQSIPGGKNLRAHCDSGQVICTDPTVGDSSGLPSTLTTTYAHSSSGIDSILDPRGVKRKYRYDSRLGRRAERDDYGQDEIAYFNAAGLLDSTKSRSGSVVRFRYDSLGRKRAMIYPSVVHSYQTTKTVPGDSISYTYDLAGNLLTASGFTSSVRRTYFSNGSLRTEAASGAGYDSLAFGYDATGARTRFIHYRGEPAALDSVSYFYGATNGDLDSMLVRWGSAQSPYQATRTFRFQWDELGRRKKVTYPAVANLNVTYYYDAMSQLREVVSSRSPSPNGDDIFAFTWENTDVDATGRILEQYMTCDGQGNPGNPCGSEDAILTANSYNRMSWLVSQQVNSKLDSTRYDASGNMVWRRKDHMSAATDSFAIAQYHNRVAEVIKSQGSDITIEYNANGGRKVEVPSPWTSAERRYYYDGLGRTSGLFTIEQITGGSADTHDNPESCRYDALGRQVLACANLGPLLGFDGHNVVRGQEWSIFHGPGLDDPLIALAHRYNGDNRELFYVTDGAGRQIAVAEANGSIFEDAFGVIDWVGWQSAGATSQAQSYDASRQSLPAAPGLSFFRNRIYDQASGRWTQEDPIGVAGGLNLYQFNGNNPVANADPFGLCPCHLWNQFKASLGLRKVPLAAEAPPNNLVIGASGTLGNVTESVTTGAVKGSGTSMILGKPQIGASLDVGFKTRDAQDGEATGGVTYGVSRHLGITVTNETVMLNIGFSYPPGGSPVTVSADVPGSSPRRVSPSIVAPADATAVRQPEPR